MELGLTNMPEKPKTVKFMPAQYPWADPWLRQLQREVDGLKGAFEQIKHNKNMPAKKPKKRPAQAEHPEDLIYATKTFMSELAYIQECYFEALCSKLGIDGEDDKSLLFDYLHNDESNDSFGEYLDRMEQSVAFLSKKEKK